MLIRVHRSNWQQEEGLEVRGHFRVALCQTCQLLILTLTTADVVLDARSF